MRTATTTASIRPVDETAHETRRSGSARFVGIAIASLVPAVFWSIVIELGSLWLGRPLSSSTIMIVGGAIALFLFAVCAPLMLRKQGAQPQAEIETLASKVKA